MFSVIHIHQHLDSKNHTQNTHMASTETHPEPDKVAEAPEAAQPEKVVEETPETAEEEKVVEAPPPEVEEAVAAPPPEVKTLADAPPPPDYFALAEVVLRFLLFASAVVAVVVIVTSKQTTITGPAKFNHSPAFM